MYSAEIGLLNIEIGYNMIGVKCFLQKSPDSAWNMTPDVFGYERKETLEITPHSYKENHRANEVD